MIFWPNKEKNSMQGGKNSQVMGTCEALVSMDSRYTSICADCLTSPPTNKYQCISAQNCSRCISWIVIYTTCYSIRCTKTRPQHWFKVRLLHIRQQNSKVRKKVHLEHMVTSNISARKVEDGDRIRKIMFILNKRCIAPEVGRSVYHLWKAAP